MCCNRKVWLLQWCWAVSVKPTSATRTSRWFPVRETSSLHHPDFHIISASEEKNKNVFRNVSFLQLKLQAQIWFQTHSTLALHEQESNRFWSCILAPCSSWFIISEKNWQDLKRWKIHPVSSRVSALKQVICGREITGRELVWAMCSSGLGTIG